MLAKTTSLRSLGETAIIPEPISVRGVEGQPNLTQYLVNPCMDNEAMATRFPGHNGSFGLLSFCSLPGRTFLEIC